MITHKIRTGGDFTIRGIDDTFRTYCGITENCSEDTAERIVSSYSKCTCKKCNSSIEKEILSFEKMSSTKRKRK